MIRKLILASFLLGVAFAADTCAPTCEDGDEGLYPDPKDCSKFYQCSFGEAVSEDCPDGLEFNPTLLVCDFPATAGCTEDPDLDCGEEGTTSAPTTIATTQRPSSEVPTSEQITSTTTLPTTAEASSTTILPTSDAAFSTTTLPTTTTSVIVSSTSGRPSTGNPFDCFPPCPSATAIYANPRDCNTYFMCFGNIPYLMTCNPGDEYNPETETCEEAGSFECLAGPDQPCVAVTAAPASLKL